MMFITFQIFLSTDRKKLVVALDLIVNERRPWHVLNQRKMDGGKFEGYQMMDAGNG